MDEKFNAGQTKKTNVVPLRIMIVDDQRSMRSIVRRLLDIEGITDVVEAENGEDALEQLNKAANAAPDAILCDMHMDKMDGMELLAHIRRGHASVDRNLPVLILTGDSDKFLEEVTLQVGATRVLHKPISAPDLAKEISQAVGYQVA